jgi:demethylmenaquinone methyltransferase / 2-methoxy-6-polyprenyl-1,4-benzoquinol methylase
MSETRVSGDKESFGFTDVPRAEKTAKVHEVFARVAPRYDLMNDLMSGGVHRIWKEIFANKVNPQPGESVLDLAGGTGDIARALRDRMEARDRPHSLQGQVIVADINADMLEAGQKRGDDAGLTWLCANAEHLPFPDGSMDAVTISFGIRNVTERLLALREIHRVLKPGGRFYCLEFSRPTTALVEKAYDAWSFNAIPRIGELIAKDRASYQYLVESIRRFPTQDQYADELCSAGLGRVGYDNLSGGIAAIHYGWRLR